jgi:hypothetical protein
MRRQRATWLDLLGVVALATGCRGSAQGVTAARLEKAVAPTFANLVEVEESMLGLPAVSATTLDASATCHKVGAANDTTGGGTWRCSIVWHDPKKRQSFVDGYELSVRTDGCYTAMVDGAAAHVGGPTVTTRTGATVKNLLYTFDGCFDTTS